MDQPSAGCSPSRAGSGLLPSRLQATIPVNQGGRYLNVSLVSVHDESSRSTPFRACKRQQITNLHLHSSLPRNHILLTRLYCLRHIRKFSGRAVLRRYLSKVKLGRITPTVHDDEPLLVFIGSGQKGNLHRSAVTPDISYSSFSRHHSLGTRGRACLLVTRTRHGNASGSRSRKWNRPVHRTSTGGQGEGVCHAGFVGRFDVGRGTGARAKSATWMPGKPRKP